MYFQYTNLFSQIYNPLNSTKYNPGRWFLSSVRMHACVWECVCVCVHAHMLLVVVVTHHVCSNTSPDSFSLLSGANLAQVETLHWKTVTFLPMKPFQKRPGWRCSLPRQQGHATPSTGQDGTGQNGSLPQSWHGYCSREWPAVEFKSKETSFSPLQPPLWHSRALLHDSYAPRSPSGAGDCRAQQGEVCPASRSAPHPAPCGRRGLATLLLEAREWARTLLDSALWQPAVPHPASGSTSIANPAGPGELHRWHQWCTYLHGVECFPIAF